MPPGYQGKFHGKYTDMARKGLPDDYAHKMFEDLNYKLNSKDDVTYGNETPGVTYNNDKVSYNPVNNTYSIDNITYDPSDVKFDSIYSNSDDLGYKVNDISYGNDLEDIANYQNRFETTPLESKGIEEALSPYTSDFEGYDAYQMANYEPETENESLYALDSLHQIDTDSDLEAEINATIYGEDKPFYEFGFRDEQLIDQNAYSEVDQPSYESLSQGEILDPIYDNSELMGNAYMDNEIDNGYLAEDSVGAYDSGGEGDGGE